MQTSFTASEITARSHKKVWWRNAIRGNWQQIPNVRTDKRGGLYSHQVDAALVELDR